MNKNILIINSRLDISPLFDFLLELKNREYSFCLLTNKQKIINKFQENKWPYKKLSIPCPDNLFYSLLFAMFAPLGVSFFFLLLAFYKYRQKTKILVLFNWPEKILATPAAKILKIKTIWFEFPESSLQNINKLLFWAYKFFSAQVKIITLNNLTKKHLETAGIKTQNITNIQLGVKLDNYQRQETIFARLAENEQIGLNRKFFSIGTAVELNDKQKVEILFQAARKCLSVIPNLQLIVVGDGKEKKNLTWLAQKIEINNLTWFVGQQAFLKKWLDSLDIFIVCSGFPGISDMRAVIQALAAGVPIISPKSIGMEDIIHNNENGLIIKAGDSEAMA